MSRYLSAILISKWFQNVISQIRLCEMQAQQFWGCELRLWQFVSCEQRLNHFESCELWVNNQAVGKESYKSVLYQVCIISLH